MKRPFIALLLSFCLLLSMISGCSKKPEITESPEIPEAAAMTEPEPTPEATPEVYDENGMYLVPFTELKELSVWDVQSDSPVSASLDSALPGELNININYSFSTPDNAQEDFALMEAAGDYADLMTQAGDYYSGGAQAAIDDGVILELSSLETDIPAAAAFEQEYGDCFRLSDNGLPYELPVVVESYFDTGAKGITTRADGLEYLEITSPETYEEFYFLLVMLKTICGAKRGYLLPDDGYCPGLAYGYGAYNGFYQVDNVVKFGIMEESYKNYMDFVYTLLDNKLAIFQQADSGYTLAGRVSSQWVDTWYGDLSQWDEVSQTIEEDKLAGIAYPVENRGDTVHFISAESYTSRGMSVWAGVDDEQYKVICALCNYLYSDEFTQRCNVWQELSDGTSVFGLLMNLPHVVDMSLVTEGMTEGRATAMTLWSQGDGAYLLPELEISEEDQQKIDTVMADINTRIDEFVPAYEQGDYDAYDYEDFRNELIEMGILEVIDIYQMALTGETVEYEEQESLNDKVTSGRSSYSYSTSSSTTTTTVETPAEAEAPAESEAPAEEIAPSEGEAPAVTAPVGETEPVEIAPDFPEVDGDGSDSDTPIEGETPAEGGSSDEVIELIIE